MDMMMFEFAAAIGLLAFFLWVQYTGNKRKKEEYLRQMAGREKEESEE